MSMTVAPVMPRRFRELSFYNIPINTASMVVHHPHGVSFSHGPGKIGDEIHVRR